MSEHRAAIDGPMGETDVFADLYARDTPGNPEIMRVLAVLAAVKETITAASQAKPPAHAASDRRKSAASLKAAAVPPSSPSPTAYFAALMTALERGGGAHAKEVFFLLARVLPTVPAAVIRMKQDAVVALLSASLSAGPIVADAGVLRTVLSCVAAALAALEPPSASTDDEGNAWARPDVSRAFSALLAFAADERPKVRKAAQAGALDVLAIHHAATRAASASGSGSSNIAAGAAAPTAAFLIDTLRVGGSQRESTRALQVLPFLRAAMPLLPVVELGPLAAALLALPSGGHAPRLAVPAYGAIAELLESPRARLTVRFVARVAAALAESRPSRDDVAAAAEHAYATAAALTRLASSARLAAGLSPEVSLSLRGRAAVSAAEGSGEVADTLGEPLVAAIESLLPALSSDRVGLHHAVANAIAVMLATAVDSVAIARGAAATAAQGQGSSSPPLVRIVAALRRLVSYEYTPAWPVALPLCALLYRLVGAASSPLMDDLTRDIVAAREAVATAAAAADALRAGDDDDDDDTRRRGGRRRGARAGGDEGSDAGDGAARRVVVADGSAAAGAGGASSPGATLRVIDGVLAAVIRAGGAEAFIRVVGLDDTQAAPGAPPTPPASVAWRLALLRDNAAFAPCPLSLFMGEVYPAIRAAEVAGARAAEAGHKRAARAFRARVIALWSILPPLVAASSPLDFAAAFNARLGKLLTGCLSPPIQGPAATAAASYPELPTIIARALETAVLCNRSAAGMPPLKSVSAAALDDDDNDAASIANDNEDGEPRVDITVADGGGRAARRIRRRGADDDEDDDDDDDDEDGDDKDGAGVDDEDERDDGGASADGDATMTVFGAGGVSVYAGGNDGDARHPLLVAAMAPRGDALPKPTPDRARANLEALGAFAKHYLPVLCNAFETTALSVGAPLPSASRAAAAAAGAGAAAPPLTSGAANERTRKLLDAITAYAAVAPPAQLTSTTSRLLALLKATRKAVVDADAAVAVARTEADAAASAAPTAAAASPAAITAAAAVKAAAATATKLAALLTLAVALLPALPQLSDEEADGAEQPAAEAAPLPSAPSNITLSFLASLMDDTLEHAVTDGVHPAVQKRAYGALAALLAVHPAFGTGTTERRERLIALLAGAGGLATVSAAARRGRLVALRYLVRGLHPERAEHVALLPPLLGETMLCTKDTNVRVRAGAFALLLAMAHRMLVAGGDGGGAAEWDSIMPAGAGDGEGDDNVDDDDDTGMGAADADDDGGSAIDEDEVAATAAASSSRRRPHRSKAPRHPLAPSTTSAPAATLRPSLTEFFRMVLGGLGAATPHMRSAALLCLATLLHAHGGRPAIRSLLEPLLSTALMLLRERSREVVKAVVGFVKVAVAVAPPAALGPLTRPIVEGLLTWSGESKNRIRAKVRIVLERLARKVGFDALAEVVPAADAPLLAALRKAAQKKRRRRLDAAAAAAEADGGAAEGGDDDDEEDDDGDDGVRTSVSRPSERRGGSRLGGGRRIDGDDGGDAATRVTAASVARSWGVIGSQVGRPTAPSRVAGAPRVAGSRMTAVTASMRQGSRLLTDAPLPPPGAILSDAARFIDKRQQAALRRTGAGGEVDDKLSHSRSRISGRKTAASGVSAAVSGVGARRGGGNHQGVQLRTDDDMPLDLLDSGGAARAFVAPAGGGAALLAAVDARRQGAVRADAGSGTAMAGGFRIDAAGRLVIPDEEAAVPSKGKKRPTTDADDVDPDVERDMADIRAHARKRVRGGAHAAQRDGDGNEEESSGHGRAAARRAGDMPPPSTAQGAQGWGQKKRKIGSTTAVTAAGGVGARHSGQQYRAAGGGDTASRAAAFEPFAYVPLDPRAMSGKHGAKAVARFAGVTASTSKGGRSTSKREGTGARASGARRGRR